jgi:hypothetical protein
MMESQKTNTTHLTILSKNQLFSFLGLVRSDQFGADDSNQTFTAIIKLDPREGQPLLKEFETHHAAIRSYQEAISTSIARGWFIVYRGQPLLG